MSRLTIETSLPKTKDLVFNEEGLKQALTAYDFRTPLAIVDQLPHGANFERIRALDILKSRQTTAIVKLPDPSQLPAIIGISIPMETQEDFALGMNLYLRGKLQTLARREKCSILLAGLIAAARTGGCLISGATIGFLTQHNLDATQLDQRPIFATGMSFALGGLYLGGALGQEFYEDIRMGFFRPYINSFNDLNPLKHIHNWHRGKAVADNTVFTYPVA